MPGYSVEVADLGLKLEEALNLGLLTEKFVRRKALPYNLDLNETERHYFEGEFRRHKQWECERVELNAFTSPGLIEFLERKLAEAGADDKLFPRQSFSTSTAGMFPPPSSERTSGGNLEFARHGSHL
jgi:hypothetical protein